MASVQNLTSLPITLDVGSYILQPGSTTALSDAHYYRSQLLIELIADGLVTLSIPPLAPIDGTVTGYLSYLPLAAHLSANQLRISNAVQVIFPKGGKDKYLEPRLRIFNKRPILKDASTPPLHDNELVDFGTVRLIGGLRQESIAMTTPILTAKMFDLTLRPTNLADIKVQGGPQLVYGVDYVISVRTVTLINDGLIAQLDTTDSLVVTY